MGRVLITGSTGLLGVRLMESYARIGDVVGTSRKHAGGNCLALDITRHDETVDLIAQVDPDLVVHSAAITDVDYCEEHREEAWATNVVGTRNVAKGCMKANCKLVYLSTDYVFDGSKGMYAEGDGTNPVNYYGLTKLEGEKIVLGSGLDYLIARTSVLYGWYEGRLNYVTWIMDRLGRKEEIKMAVDRYKSPTLTDNLAGLLADLYKLEASGILHTCGSERISMYDMAVKVADAFQLDKRMIKPQKSSDYKQTAVRPNDSSLDVSKVRKLGLRLFDLSEGLDYMKVHK